MLNGAGASLRYLCRFPLLVTGKSDNSLLSLFPFIAQNPDAYYVATAEEKHDALHYFDRVSAYLEKYAHAVRSMLTHCLPV